MTQARTTCSCSISGVLARSKKAPTGGSSGLTGNAGGSELMSFKPIHWITNFSNAPNLHYVLVALSVPSWVRYSKQDEIYHF
jgi:hypothetical protein